MFSTMEIPDQFPLCSKKNGNFMNMRRRTGFYNENFIETVSVIGSFDPFELALFEKYSYD